MESPKNDFFERLRQASSPVVVDFWAPWCAPCRAIGPVVEKLEHQYDGQVTVWKVNADEQPELLRKLGIYGIPTLVAFRQGQEVARQTGAGSPQAIANLFVAALSGKKPASTGLQPLERLVRLGAGLILMFLAFQGHFTGLYLLLGLVAAGVIFSGIYDRCPIWQTLAPKLAAWLREKSGETDTPV